MYTNTTHGPTGIHVHTYLGLLEARERLRLRQHGGELRVPVLQVLLDGDYSGFGFEVLVGCSNVLLGWALAVGAYGRDYGRTLTPCQPTTPRV